MEAPQIYVPPWEYSCSMNLVSSDTLPPVGPLTGLDMGPSNCGNIEISWAPAAEVPTSESLKELGPYPNIDKFIWGIATGSPSPDGISTIYNYINLKKHTEKVNIYAH